jgi:dihydrolipoamide dehydrogenase
MVMSDRYDVVIIGGGPGGEVAVNTLLRGGLRVALVEGEVLGGECTNWGCIPSKTLLRPTELKAKCARAAGVSTPPLDFAGLSDYRDYMVSSHDDTSRVLRYEERGVHVVKDTGRIVGPGRVEAGGEVLEADAIVVATGAEAIVPPIPGLVESGFWTNRETTDLTAIPASAVVVGGGAVGCELSQFLARFGSQVTLVQGPPRLADREEPQIGDLLAELLEADGIELRLGRRAGAVRLDGDRRIVTLDNGDEVAGEVVVIGTGRRPRTGDLGLETVGIEPGRRGIAVDDRLRAGDRIWAVGDVTGIAQFTHVAKYQARIAAMDVMGLDARADYRAVPRVYFTDPEIACVGMTETGAREAGIEVAAATIDLPTSIARPYTFQENPTGTFGIVADAERQILLGAWAVAPLASEWIHACVLAVRAEIPIEVLKDTIAQFPSFSEAVGAALRALPTESVHTMMDHRPHPMMTAELAGARP